ncbi:hypothetical protein [Kutzneria buriramensis]|uniref:Uncharacterized protein n=1 Tax=Kutzneria buriramensis TaxID=1045776 RepID=A0A3E0HF00_9PSEU|nr:hypothetical protein [Kutzneria buriramensis]REH43778.1 hypothetical protein BCF44_109321 [Kutzneria buriramensis]
MIGLAHLVVMFGFLVVGIALLLVVLWPTARSGPRLLRNWGVAQATQEQGRLARLYLLERRVLYVVFLVLAVPLDLLTSLYSGRAYFSYVGWLLFALLAAEAIAVLRPVRGQVRVATLARRRVGDVLPRWMMAAHLVMVVAAAAVMTVVGVEGNLPDAWVAVAEVVASAAAVYAAAWCAVARPARSDAELDRALRLRSARVPIGLGTMFAATVLGAALSILGDWQHSADLGVIALFVQGIGLVLWGVMVSVSAFWMGFRGQVPAGNG